MGAVVKDCIELNNDILSKPEQRVLPAKNVIIQGPIKIKGEGW